MENIKDTIKNVIQVLGTKRGKARRDNPQVLLTRVFSKKELEHVRLHYFRKGIMGVKVDSSPWLYCLNLKKDGLLVKLRKNNPTAKDIRFCIGEIK